MAHIPLGTDDSGRRTSLTFPNSYTGTHSYNGHRLYDVTWRNTVPNTVVSNSYTFDNASNITGITSSNGLSGTRSYTYDQLGRLYTRSTTGSLNAPYGSLTWNLDAVGNRISTVSGSSTTTYTLNTAYMNQYASVTGIGTQHYL